MPDPSPLDIGVYLVPISEDNPSGESLRYEEEYWQIERAREEEEDADSADPWKKGNPKKADWEAVISLGLKALKEKTKDIEIAALVAEALIRRRGLAGLRDGLRLIRAIQDAFWETAHPSSGDLELREGVYEFLDDEKRLPLLIRYVPLVSVSGLPPYSFLKYKESREVENFIRKSPERADELLAEGKIRAEEFDRAVDATDRAFYVSTIALLGECLEAASQLNLSIRAAEHYGNRGSSLSRTIDALEEVEKLANQILSRKPAPAPAPAEAYDEPEASWSEDTAVAGSRPVTVTGRVHFSLTAPARLEPGGSYALDVWAYIEARRAEVMALARESQGTDDIRVKTKSGVVIARGVVMTVRLAIPTLEVADPEDVIDWDGQIANATFPVSVPAEARPGPHAGTVTFHVDQLRITKLHFVLEVDRGSAFVAHLAVREARCKFAFASYASEDRDEVLGRLQGILKVLPDLDLFLDVASLRSGERWEERLYQEIARRDTLYLFWSHAASRSHWDSASGRTALALWGIAGIDPVPLVSPEEVSPPAELAQHLHFNDWLLAFMRGRRES